MELSEGLSIVKPPKRAATFGAKPTLDQLQRRLPLAEGAGPLIPSPAPDQAKQWAAQIWQSHGTQQSYNALRTAIHAYNTAASTEKLALIQERSASFLDVRNAAFAARDRRAKEAASSNKIVRKMKSGLDKFCSTIYFYAPIVDVLSQATPEYAVLAWGAIRFLLIMNINSVELKETVLQKLADIGEQFEVIRCFLGLYPSEAMTKHVCGAYEAFTTFLAEAVKYYQENAIKKFFKNVTHPYKIRFEPLVTAINGHVLKVKEVASLGQGIAIAENTTITKQTRALIAMGNWKLDEANEKVEGLTHGLTAMMEAAQSQFDWQRQQAEEARKREEVDPFEASKTLLSTRALPTVLLLICPSTIAPASLDSTPQAELSRLSLAAEARGTTSRTYERLGLLENPKINAWVESRSSSFLYIDGFFSRPDWTTQLSLDVIHAARGAGNVVLSLMAGEQLSTPVSSSSDSASQNASCPVAWAWSFIEQLARQRPDYFTLEAQCALVTGLLTAQADFKGVWQVLLSSIRATNFGFIYIVIDNIDTAFNESPNAGELAELLAGLDALTRIESRVIKVLITARRTRFQDVTPPQSMVVVSVSPLANVGKGRPSGRKGVLASMSKPRMRPARLPDRDTGADVTLSDSSEWDDEKLEEMLESSDEEGRKKKARRRERGRKASVVKTVASDVDSLDSLDEDSLDERPKGDAKGRVASAKRRVAGTESDDSLESSDSLDSLDSLKSLDSLDKALKTSSDEEFSPKAIQKKAKDSSRLKIKKNIVGKATSSESTGFISTHAAAHVEPTWTHSPEGSDSGLDST